MKAYTSTICAISLLVFSISSNAQTTVSLDSTMLTEREVAIDLQVPWEILWGPDEHIWATEKRGRVLRIEPETGNTTTVLNIESAVESGAEPGLLGMALHPSFNDTPKVYLVYTYPSGGFSSSERLVSYDWDGTELSNEQILLDGISAGGIHNGSRILFSPDGKILMTVGDRGTSNLSQNMTSLNGKLLRINPDGSIPSDNPINGSYIYSWGHRNAQGLAYGPNGLLYSSEHGQNTSDEFNLIEPDRNYGWPSVEGECNTNAEINFCNANNVREPLTEWTPCVAVNGLAYYNHDAIPEWKGKMLMAVLGGFVIDPRLSVLSFNNDGTEVTGEERYFENYGRLRDVCINPENGAVYFATNGNSYPSRGPNRIIEYRNLDFEEPQDTVTTSIAEPEKVYVQFVNISPNPLNQGGILQFDLSESFLGIEMELYDYEGSLISKTTVNETAFSFDISKLPAANYFVKLQSDLGMITKKIMVN